MDFEALYHLESRRVLATLIRLPGDFDLAEEDLHDAVTAGLKPSPRDGVPASPRAWLVLPSTPAQRIVRAKTKIKEARIGRYVCLLQTRNTSRLQRRIPHGSGIQLGKFNVGTRKGYFSYGGKEINVDLGNAQVFVGKGVWRHWNGNLPAGAIPAGRDDDGSLLYMIRASVPGVPGAQSVGKYTDARKQAYVPYGGNEVLVTDFDILSYDLNAPGLAPSALSQPVSQPAASDSEAPSVPTPINTQYGYWRIHEQFGPANVGPDGKYSAVFTYDAVSGEMVKISTLGTTLTLISPDGTKIDAPPAPTRTIQTKLRTTGTYTIEISSASPESFYMTLIGRGYEFRGNLDSRSPVRSDGRHYAQFELSGLPQQPSGTGKAVYQIDAISRDFQPVILSVWDKETGKRLPLLSEQKDNLREIAFFVNPPSGRIEVHVGAAGGSFPKWAVQIDSCLFAFRL